jgi:hypothetical protein
MGSARSEGHTIAPGLSKATPVLKYSKIQALKKHYGDIYPTCSIELFGDPPPHPEKATCELWGTGKIFFL